MLNNKMLISVIIPYFKKKKFIFKTINSVLNQSYKNLEVIIIYDDKVTLEEIAELTDIVLHRFPAVRDD